MSRKSRSLYVYTDDNHYLLDGEGHLTRGNVEIADFARTPPLATALRVFIDAVRGQNDGRLGLALGESVVKLLAKIDAFPLKENQNE